MFLIVTNISYRNSSNNPKMYNFTHKYFKGYTLLHIHCTMIKRHNVKIFNFPAYEVDQIDKICNT